MQRIEKRLQEITAEVSSLVGVIGNMCVVGVPQEVSDRLSALGEEREQLTKDKQKAEENNGVLDKLFNKPPKDSLGETLFGRTDEKRIDKDKDDNADKIFMRIIY